METENRERARYGRVTLKLRKKIEPYFTDEGGIRPYETLKGENRPIRIEVGLRITVLKLWEASFLCQCHAGLESKLRIKSGGLQDSIWDCSRYSPHDTRGGESDHLYSERTCTVSGLGPRIYYFVVLAYNTSGLQSPSSNEVSVTITAHPPPPSPPPPTNPSLTASSGSVGPGGNVTVSWSAIGNASVRDWIGHYPAAANDGGYTTWKYTSSCGQSPGGLPLPSGSCIFAMPTVPGIYQFRLFANETYTRLAASGMVTVSGGGSLTASPSAVAPGGTVTVSWNNLSASAVNDWIGRYVVGSADPDYGDWKFSSSCAQNLGSSAQSSGSCLFTMPLISGTYEFRLFAGESYTRRAVSAPVMVGAP
jgi:hypothetical protein